jgi:hypothetical protein
VLDLQNILCNTCSIFLFNYEHNIHLLNTTYMCFISYCVFCLFLTISSSLSFQSACNCSCCPSHAFDWKLRVYIALENMIREIKHMCLCYTVSCFHGKCIFYILNLNFHREFNTTPSLTISQTLTLINTKQFPIHSTCILHYPLLILTVW